MIRVRRPLFTLVAILGCATLGNEAPFPAPVQTSGAGPFRRLDRYETGIPGSPVGRAAMLAGATTGGMFVSGYLFYVEAPPKAEPPERDQGLAPDEVDWAQFEPRRILRAPSRPADLGHDGGVEVLRASEGWEGGGVYDPWVVADEEGRAVLYYAGDGGIGIATAPSLDGEWTRMAGPIVPDARSPSVVPAPDGGWLMYFESAEGIGVARSRDGVSFTELTRTLDLSAPTPATEPAERSVRRPGAVTVTTPTGRLLVRLYFESLREDGTRAIGFAASEDGVTFERRPGSVYDEDDPGAPAPFVDAEGRTRLYLTVDARLRGTDLVTRALVMAVAPPWERYAPLPEDEAE